MYTHSISIMQASVVWWMWKPWRKWRTTQTSARGWSCGLRVRSKKMNTYIVVLDFYLCREWIGRRGDWLSVIEGAFWQPSFRENNWGSIRSWNSSIFQDWKGGVWDLSGPASLCYIQGKFKMFKYIWTMLISLLVGWSTDLYQAEGQQTCWSKRKIRSGEH